MKVRGETTEIISTLTPALSRQREREIKKKAYVHRSRMANPS